MEERGLELSEEKTIITHIDDGFDFLGVNIRMYDGKLLTKPSKENVKAFLAKVRRTIKAQAQGTQEELIRKLNPMITDWINFQRHNVLTAAEVKALAANNPLLAEKMTVDNEISRLKLLKGEWKNTSESFT